jgi:type I restriction enzyme S subunit
MLTKINPAETGLKLSELEKIHEILRCHEEVEKAILYGSRAIGSYKDYSDIDLTLVGTKIDLTIQNKIENELDDLLLPYKFDISDYHKIKNIDLIDHIKKYGKVLYSR